MMTIQRTFRDGIKIFLDNHCFERAAAISFFAFFSLIPILFLVISALGFVLGARSDILERVIDFARITLPYLSGRIVEDLHGLIGAWRTFGWFSIVALILSAELVLNVVGDALAAVFDVRQRYGFFRKRILNLFVLTMGVTAAFISIVLTAVLGILKGYNVTLLGIDLTHYLIESLAMKYLFPFVLVVCAVTVVYKIFSGPNLLLRYAFYGGLLFGFLWEIAKQCFAMYLYYFPTYNRVYGSLGTIMILLIWMFFSAAIFLFCASVARAAFRNYYWKRV